MQLFKEKEERQNQLKNTTSRQNITFLNFPIEKFAHFKGIVYFCTQSYVDRNSAERHEGRFEVIPCWNLDNSSVGG